MIPSTLKDKISLDLDKETRATLTEQVLLRANAYHEDTRATRITTQQSRKELQEVISSLIHHPKHDPSQSLQDLLQAFESGCLHNSHPRYLGLFTPRVPFVAALSEFIKAVYNPNLGSWGHAPFAVESESVLIKEVGEKFGYTRESVDGIFTSGGAEGNLNGLLCGLASRYEAFRKEGLAQIGKQPVLYCSVESHHSIVKAARMVGIGQNAIRIIPTDDRQRMDATLLEAQIVDDLTDGLDPFMLISTAGTTGSGAIDPIELNHQIARKFELWHHVDAAYGGALIFHEKLRKQLAGIAKSDSISFDLHKWPASPVGTNMFLTSHPTVLHELYAVQAGYMPDESVEGVDPYTHSPKWSRRYIGLSFLTMLAIYGWDGYEEIIQRQWQVGKYLKRKLEEADWLIVNETELPLICFTHPKIENEPNKVQEIADRMVKSGRAWISTYEINGQLTFRACITNYATDEEDIQNLLSILHEQLNQLI